MSYTWDAGWWNAKGIIITAILLLSPTSCVDPAAVAVSASGGQPAQVSWVPGDGISRGILFDLAFEELWSVDPTTRELTQLTSYTSRREARQPSLHPSGDSVAFIDRTGLNVMAVDGTGRRALTSVTGYNPAWSPDGSQLATISPSSTIEIWTAEGELVRSLAGYGRAYHRPQWSPDGSQLVWTSDALEVVIGRVDGSDSRVVSQSGRYAYCPDWSPVGGRVAFAMHSPGKYEVYTVAVDGTDLRQETALPAQTHAGCVSWSPDGARLAFEHKSPPGELWNIAVLDLATGDVEVLTNVDRIWNPMANPDWGYPKPQVQPSTTEDCQNMGWEQYGFRNQGQCVRFVQAGKDSR